MVVTNITSDPIKIIFFALGSLVGSYIGSILEEKIALGDILINCISNNNNLYKYINNMGYNTNNIKTDNENIILFVIPRKSKNKVINSIKNIDKNCLILSEKVKNFS